MIRSYKDFDYERLKDLYQHSEWYGGQFDDARDSKEKITNVITKDPEAILVYDEKDQILGTVSLVEDGRVAWLFRFAVRDNDIKVAKELYKKALEILKDRGHTQVQVYSPVGNRALDNRYTSLGMLKGHDFTAYWKDIL